jgi:hypothetical protein
MATLERIDFLSHSGEQPELIASFFYSDELGLRSTNDFLMHELETQGIAVPPDGDRVYPRDGRKCFDALKWRASSYVEVTPARVVESGPLLN